MIAVFDAQLRQRFSALSVLVEHFDGRAQKDVEALVDQHLEEAVVARPGDDLEAARSEDVDVDPAEAEAVGRTAQVVERPDAREALPDPRRESETRNSRRGSCRPGCGSG